MVPPERDTAWTIPHRPALTVRFAVSPDGKRLAFVRGNLASKGESALIIANADGTGEQALATRRLPQSFSPIYFTGPSWSPDGRSVALTDVNQSDYVGGGTALIGAIDLLLQHGAGPSIGAKFHGYPFAIARERGNK